ncbi:MAG: hypothetical protein KTR29_00840 [Rhodothermaceae bacterium]|nr:hypothetical protein [Rhodothermaceae bacterium]
MKLRISGNSIRIRLQQQELAYLIKFGLVQDSVTFSLDPSRSLSYALVAADHVNEVEAQYEEGQILISVPKQVLTEIAETDRVGISYQKRLGDDTLAILIEKDYKCLTPRAEDEDAFPHPEQKNC